MPRLMRVATAIGLHYGWGRSVLHGVAEFMRQTRSWLLLAEPTEVKPEHLVAQLDAIDGAIINTADLEIIERLQQRRLPFVNLNTRPYEQGIRAPCVGNNEAVIGALAASHLIGLGLRNFAFCGVTAASANTDRGQGFFLKIRSQTHTTGPLNWRYEYSPLDLRRRARDKLAPWLVSLPRPVGVMAYNDLIARHIAEACLLAKLAVPQEVAVIGVDNDDLVCELATPPLSSIDVNGTRQGFLAATLLNQWMRGRPSKPVRHLISPARLVPRQSTNIVAVSDPVVARAMAFILAHFNQNIGVKAVVAQIDESRRKLEYRFRSVLNSTPQKEIQRLRMQHAQDLLATTTLATATIAQHCGYSRASYFSEAFLRATGNTPTGYRKRCLG
ncbi:MAG TPA: DNA-binding transcriptional regulator [Planctomycetota bacterium]|jgi:LacI family transcriptional regulator